jgi:hypothetical protein
LRLGLRRSSASIKGGPDGAKWLANAELIARQLSSFFDGTADVPRIAKHMRLPAFQYAAFDPYTWPPARK